MGRGIVQFRMGSPAKLKKLVGRDLTKKFSDFRPAWRRLLPLWASGLEENVRTRGKSLGEDWAPLKSGKPARLIATGHLVSRLGNPKRVKRSLTRRKLSVGPKESLPYIHHFGSEKSKLPPRPFIAISNRMARDANKIIGNHLDAQIEAFSNEFDRVMGVG